MRKVTQRYDALLKGSVSSAAHSDQNTRMKTTATALALLAFVTLPALAQQRSGEFFITQSWSQEKDFERQYIVRVPDHKPDERLPVLIFLHGNGGNAQGAGGFARRNRQIASRYIMVFANGYAKSWNIVSERSQANDTKFIEAIINTLAKQPNVQPNNFSIMGTSNGAALVNQIAIESKLPNIRNLISSVSPLNGFQYDGRNFKARGDDNNYREIAKPVTGRRLMNISGTEDRLVPYTGGPSRAIPAKGGKLSFVDAEESAYVWAKHYGYKGEKLKQPTGTEGRLDIFSYSGGNVIHYKVNDEGHGATNAVSEPMLLAFLEGGNSKPEGDRRRASVSTRRMRESKQQVMQPLRNKLSDLVRKNQITSEEADALFNAVYPDAKRVTATQPAMKNPLVGTWKLASDWGKGEDIQFMTVQPDLTGTMQGDKGDEPTKLRGLESKDGIIRFSFFYAGKEEYDIKFTGKLTADRKLEGTYRAFGAEATVSGRPMTADSMRSKRREPMVFREYKARRFKAPNGDELPYRLFIPRDYDRTKKYPLVLFHHGGGGAGDDNRRNLEGACVHEWIRPDAQSKNPCFIVAPQIPGKKSRDVKPGESPIEQMKRRIRTVHHIIDSLEEEFSIDKSREYVTGLSFGGECTWLSLMARPERFAAAVPICAGDRLMGVSNERRGEQFAKFPLWIFHGDADKVISVDVSRRIVKALRDADGDPKFTEYPGVGHYSWDRAYRDPKLIEWLFAQKKD